MNELEEQMDLARNIKMLEELAKRKMTKEAISRYGNLKIAHPELAIKAISLIAQASQSGQINTVDDLQFKELLRQIQDKKTFRLK